MNRVNRTMLAALAPALVGLAAASAASADAPAGPGPVASNPHLTGRAPAAAPTTQPTPIPPTTALASLPSAPTTTPVPTIPPTAVPPTAAPPTAAPPMSGVPATYRTVVDDTGMLTVEIPDAWNDVDTRRFVNDDGTLRPGITASTDLDEFVDQWDVPGISYSAFPFANDPNVLLNRYDFSNGCTDDGIVAYGDEVFTGYVHAYSDCGDVGSMNHVIVAYPPGSVITVTLVVQSVSPADALHYEHVLETFNVDPNVPMPTDTVPPPTSAPATTTPVATGVPPTVPPTPTVPPSAGPAPTSPPLPTSPMLTTTSSPA